MLGAKPTPYRGDLRALLGDVGTSMAALRLRGTPGDSSPEPLEPSEVPLALLCSGLLSSSAEPESLSPAGAAMGRGKGCMACFLKGSGMAPSGA